MGAGMFFDYVKNRIIRGAVRLGTSLIRNKTKRDYARRALLHKYSLVSFPYYNGKLKIYPPHYSPNILPGSAEPDVYNKDGERVTTIFCRDYYAVHYRTMPSRYMLFDRYNIGLNTHFYGHMSMRETMGKPTRRYGYLMETRAVVPEDYRIFERYRGLNKDFDLVFTHDHDIVEKYDNARFWPSWAASWIPDELVSPQLIEKKTKMASMVSSYKTTCDLHHARTAAAKYLKANPQLGVDTFGTFDGGQHIKIQDSLLDYRYSIAVENYISPWLFTEKLINCFVTCTVPVYVGASDIGKFFNVDGIIRIDPEDLRDMDKVVAQFSVADYEARREAILDNFRRAAEYGNPWDYLYTHYLR